MFPVCYVVVQFHRFSHGFSARARGFSLAAAEHSDNIFQFMRHNGAAIGVIGSSVTWALMVGLYFGLPLNLVF